MIKLISYLVNIGKDGLPGVGDGLLHHFPRVLPLRFDEVDAVFRTPVVAEPALPVPVHDLGDVAVGLKKIEAVKVKGRSIYWQRFLLVKRL